MGHVIAHIRPFAFLIPVRGKMSQRNKYPPEYLGVYDMSFKEFKKKHKNDWPEDSIQDYTTRNIDTQNHILATSPQCLIDKRNITIEKLLNDN